jgi:hypothetical protein
LRIEFCSEYAVLRTYRNKEPSSLNRVEPTFSGTTAVQSSVFFRQIALNYGQSTTYTSAKSFIFINMRLSREAQNPPIFGSLGGNPLPAPTNQICGAGVIVIVTHCGSPDRGTIEI